MIHMEKLHIVGGRRLCGTVRISGMKNAALPILFACALNSETCILQNVPRVKDVDTAIRILADMGVQISYLNKTTLQINGAGFRPGSSPDDLVRSIRASSYLMGVELARAGKTRIASPGGCDFGARPLDYHTGAFEKMGAEMDCLTEIRGEAPDGLHAAKIVLPTVSVGATVNIMLAASLIKGETTTIVNAAHEPHIADLARFLSACGATVTGAGTSEIQIHGVESLHGCTHKIIPDMIEAGTYMAAVAGTGGTIALEGVVSKHLESVISKLTEMGVDIREDEGGNGTVLTVSSSGKLKGVQIKTDVYPGFPTDMHPQIAPLLAIADGVSSITENIWNRRFDYLTELARAGASYAYPGSGNTVTFFPSRSASSDKPGLIGASMTATDLRGGAAMVIAALMASGESDVYRADIIDRGYDDLIGKLRGLGAEISREEVPTNAPSPSPARIFS